MVRHMVQGTLTVAVGAAAAGVGTFQPI